MCYTNTIGFFFCFGIPSATNIGPDRRPQIKQISQQSTIVTETLKFDNRHHFHQTEDFLVGLSKALQENVFAESLINNEMTTIFTGDSQNMDQRRTCTTNGSWQLFRGKTAHNSHKDTSSAPGTGCFKDSFPTHTFFKWLSSQQST